jgi:hypothetical protein
MPDNLTSIDVTFKTPTEIINGFSLTSLEIVGTNISLAAQISDYYWLKITGVAVPEFIRFLL